MDTKSEENEPKMLKNVLKSKKSVWKSDFLASKSQKKESKTLKNVHLAILVAKNRQTQLVSFLIVFGSFFWLLEA